MYVRVKKGKGHVTLGAPDNRRLRERQLYEVDDDIAAAAVASGDLEQLQPVATVTAPPVGGSGLVREWAAGEYGAGDVVIHSDKIWEAQADTTDTPGPASDWDEISAGTMLPIAQADVTGLVAALAGKAAAGHTHVIADITGLQAALDAKQNTGGAPPTYASYAALHA